MTGYIAAPEICCWFIDDFPPLITTTWSSDIVSVSRSLPASQQPFLLIEVPADVVSRLEQQIDVDRNGYGALNRSSHDHTMDEDPQAPVIDVLKLSKSKDAENGTSSPTAFTASLFPDRLLVGELHKISGSLIFGILATPFQSTSFGTHPSDSHRRTDGNNVSSVIRSIESFHTLLQYPLLDFIWVGESQGVLTLQPTYPRVDQLFKELQCSLSSQPLTTSTVVGEGRTIGDLLTTVQIAPNQLKRLLLEGYFLCSHFVSQNHHQDYWVPIAIADLLSLLRLVLTGLRLSAASCHGFDLQTTICWIVSASTGLTPCPQFLLCLHVLYQVLQFFCDVEQPAFNLDVIAKTSPTQTAYTDYVERLTLIPPSLTFSLNKNKILRLLARDSILKAVSPVPVGALIREVSENLKSLLPIELELDLGLNRETDFFFSRGDGPIVLSKNNFYFAHAPKDYCHILHHLIGFAVYSDSATLTHLIPLIHYEHLSFDWKSRLQEMFKLKSLWAAKELDCYLEPLRALCDVPLTEEVVAKYLVNRGKDKIGRYLYFNFRLILG